MAAIASNNDDLPDPDGPVNNRPARGTSNCLAPWNVPQFTNCTLQRRCWPITFELLELLDRAAVDATRR